jgi:hypothetical protein
LGLRGGKCWEAGGDCIIRSFITCIVQQNIIRIMESRKMRWAGADSTDGRDEKCIESSGLKNWREEATRKI